MSRPSFSTSPKNPDDFATAFRNGDLCVSFRDLNLVGPEGGFRAYGMLFRKEDQLYLECTPIDRGEVPTFERKRVYQKDDFWSATGETLSGLTLRFKDLPLGEFTGDNSHKDFDTGRETQRFKIAAHEIEILRNDHVPDEKLPIVVKDEERAKKLINERRTKGIGRFRAQIANTKLRFQNSASGYYDVHPYFNHPAKEEKFDCLHGALLGYRYAFRQSGDDIDVYLDTDGTCKTSVEENQRFFTALLDGLSFLQGDDARPYRVCYERNGHNSPDIFKANFRGREGARQPCGGAYECADKDNLAVRILETVVAFFATNDGPLAEGLRKFHWQVREAAAGTIYQLYSALHLCSILEGLSKLVLIESAGWSIKRTSTTSASDRFKATCNHLGITWDGEFERVIKCWKNPRNALAHGDLFSKQAEESQFTIIDVVSGGILAYMLKAMGWSEDITFDTLDKVGFLFYKGSDGMIIRSVRTSHY